MAEVLTTKDEKRSIYRKICLDEKGIAIGAILINQVGDLGVIHGLIRAGKDAGTLKLKSILELPLSYRMVYKNLWKI